MIAVAVLPVLAALVLARCAPAAARRCRPEVATVLFTALALATALLTGLALCVVACLGLAEIPALAHSGDWSAPVLEHRSPVPAVVGAVAAAVVATAVSRALWHVTLVARRLVVAARLRRSLDPARAGLAVLPDDAVGAFALPGRRGLVVLSQGLLDELPPAERRAVVAHESAHLRYRHVRFVQLTELAAAVNPLLRPVVAEVRLATESWADAVAARSVGDPALVARAIARTALAKRPLATLGAAPAIDGGDVAARVSGLLTPRPPRPLRAVGLTLGTLACGVAVGVFALDAHAAFEVAEAAFARR